MRRIFALAGLSMAVFVPAAQAATDADCQSLWKTLDVNVNGAIDKTEDTKGYIGAMQSGGVKLANPEVASRDEFLAYCKDKITDVRSSSPQNSKDFGKGDLTPAKSALSAQDVQKKLEANGFKNVRDLKLDNQGIWRGMADADVKDKFVAVDAQGDVMADAKQAPGVKSDPTAPASGTPASPASSVSLPSPSTVTMDVEPKTGNSESAAPSPPSTAAKTGPDADNIERGSSPTSGLLVWLFILIGNAGALLFLNSVGGPTSAMGGGPGSVRDRQ
jgi:hypothetical protein